MLILQVFFQPGKHPAPALLAHGEGLLGFDLAFDPGQFPVKTCHGTKVDPVFSRDNGHIVLPVKMNLGHLQPVGDNFFRQQDDRECL